MSHHGEPGLAEVESGKRNDRPQRWSPQWR
jgi:hypothetical protein